MSHSDSASDIDIDISDDEENTRMPTSSSSSHPSSSTSSSSPSPFSFLSASAASRIASLRAEKTSSLPPSRNSQHQNIDENKKNPNVKHKNSTDDSDDHDHDDQYDDEDNFEVEEEETNDESLDFDALRKQFADSRKLLEEENLKIKQREKDRENEKNTKDNEKNPTIFQAKEEEDKQEENHNNNDNDNQNNVEVSDDEKEHSHSSAHSDDKEIDMDPQTDTLSSSPTLTLTPPLSHFLRFHHVMLPTTPLLTNAQIAQIIEEMYQYVGSGGGRERVRWMDGRREMERIEMGRERGEEEMGNAIHNIVESCKEIYQNKNSLNFHPSLPLRNPTTPPLPPSLPHLLLSYYHSKYSTPSHSRAQLTKFIFSLSLSCRLSTPTPPRKFLWFYRFLGLSEDQYYGFHNTQIGQEESINEYSASFSYYLSLLEDINMVSLDSTTLTLSPPYIHLDRVMDIINGSLWLSLSTKEILMSKMDKIKIPYQSAYLLSKNDYIGTFSDTFMLDTDDFLHEMMVNRRRYEVTIRDEMESLYILLIGSKEKMGWERKKFNNFREFKEGFMMVKKSSEGEEEGESGHEDNIHLAKIFREMAILSLQTPFPSSSSSPSLFITLRSFSLILRSHGYDCLLSPPSLCESLLPSLLTQWEQKEKRFGNVVKDAEYLRKLLEERDMGDGEGEGESREIMMNFREGIMKSEVGKKIMREEREKGDGEESSSPTGHMTWGQQILIHAIQSTSSRHGNSDSSPSTFSSPHSLLSYLHGQLRLHSSHCISYSSLVDFLLDTFLMTEDNITMAINKTTQFISSAIHHANHSHNTSSSPLSGMMMVMLRVFGVNVSMESGKVDQENPLMDISPTTLHYYMKMILFFSSLSSSSSSSSTTHTLSPSFDITSLSLSQSSLSPLLHPTPLTLSSSSSPLSPSPPPYIGILLSFPPPFLSSLREEFAYKGGTLQSVDVLSLVMKKRLDMEKGEGKEIEDIIEKKGGGEKIFDIQTLSSVINHIDAFPPPICHSLLQSMSIRFTTPPYPPNHIIASTLLGAGVRKIVSEVEEEMVRKREEEEERLEKEEEEKRAEEERIERENEEKEEEERERNEYKIRMEQIEKDKEEEKEREKEREIEKEREKENQKTLLSSAPSPSPSSVPSSPSQSHPHHHPHPSTPLSSSSHSSVSHQSSPTFSPVSSSSSVSLPPPSSPPIFLPTEISSPVQIQKEFSEHFQSKSSSSPSRPPRKSSTSPSKSPSRRPQRPASVSATDVIPNTKSSQLRLLKAKSSTSDEKAKRKGKLISKDNERGRRGTSSPLRNEKQRVLSSHRNHQNHTNENDNGNENYTEQWENESLDPSHHSPPPRSSSSTSYLPPRLSHPHLHSECNSHIHHLQVEMSSLKSQMEISEKRLGEVNDHVRDLRQKNGDMMEQFTRKLMEEEKKRVEAESSLREYKANTPPATYKDLLSSGGKIPKELFDKKERESIESEFQFLNNLIRTYDDQNAQLTLKVKEGGMALQKAYDVKENAMISEIHQLKMRCDTLTNELNTANHKVKVAELHAKQMHSMHTIQQENHQQIQQENESHNIHSSPSSSSPPSLAIGVPSVPSSPPSHSLHIDHEGDSKWWREEAKKWKSLYEQKENEIQNAFSASNKLKDESKYPTRVGHENVSIISSLSPSPSLPLLTLGDFESLLSSKDSEITSLRTKLSWYAENQSLIDKYDEKLRHSQTNISSLEQKMSNLLSIIPRDILAKYESDPSVPKLKSKPQDTRRIKHLEKQLSDIKESIRVSSSNPADPLSIIKMIESTKISVEENEGLQELQRENGVLRERIEEKEEEMERKIRTLRQEHEKVKEIYENKMKKLTTMGDQNNASHVHSNDRTTNPTVLRNRILVLEKQLNEVKGRLGRRIEELENELEEQYKNNETNHTNNTNNNDHPHDKKEETEKENFPHHHSSPSSTPSSPSKTSAAIVKSPPSSPSKQRKSSLSSPSPPPSHSPSSPPSFSPSDPSFLHYLTTLRTEETKRFNSLESKYNHQIQITQSEVMTLRGELTECHRSLRVLSDRLKSSNDENIALRVENNTLKSTPQFVQLERLEFRVEKLTEELRNKISQMEGMEMEMNKIMGKERERTQEAFQRRIQQKNQQIKVFKKQLESLMASMRRKQHGMEEWERREEEGNKSGDGRTSEEEEANHHHSHHRVPSSSSSSVHLDDINVNVNHLVPKKNYGNSFRLQTKEIEKMRREFELSAMHM